MTLLAALVLALHLAWIVWVIFGALLTRGRPWLSGFHIASLLWGIVAEVGPWPCPLTTLEQRFESASAVPGAALHAYTGGCLVHYLDAIVYPNVPVTVLVACAVAVCTANLLVYLFRLRRALRPASQRP